MLFMRHDRNNNGNKLRTNSERCAQVGALFGTLLVIITAILLYFAITTEHGEQKTIYFIVSFVNIILLFLLVGFTIYYVRKFMIKEELDKINNKFNNINNLSSSSTTNSATAMMRRNSSNSRIQIIQEQNNKKPNYALNQPIPIIIHSTVSPNNQQQQGSLVNKEKNMKFYEI